MSVLELAKLIVRLAESESTINFHPARNEVQHAHAIHLKAKRVFHGQVVGNDISIEDGLKRTIQYVRDHPIPPPTECPSPIELTNGLPHSWKKRLMPD